jgi:hypothetical protein
MLKRNLTSQGLPNLSFVRVAYGGRACQFRPTGTNPRRSARDDTVERSDDDWEQPGHVRQGRVRSMTIAAAAIVMLALTTTINSLCPDVGAAA